MKNIEIIVVGAGPVGLYLASKLEEKKKDYLLLESDSEVGGQITRLYPQKLVVDVPLFGECQAHEIVEKLLAKIDKKKVHTSEKVLDIKNENQNISVKTSLETYVSKAVIIATGLGESEPRPLGVPNEKECQEILYELKDPSLLKGKRVVIFGGGDSALDWARDLSRLALETHLVHRRTEFRGDPKTIEGRPIVLHLPFVPQAIAMKEGHLQSVAIQNVATKEEKEIPTDFVLVNYGQIPVPSTFGLPLSSEGFGILSSQEYEVLPGIFVAGDVCFDKNRKKRMVPGFEEADTILNSKALANRLLE